MGWKRRTSSFVNYAFRFYKSKNILYHTHKPNSESISRTRPFSTISKFSLPYLRNRNPFQESISLPKPKIFRNPIQESLSRTKPFSKISKLTQSILRKNPVQETIPVPKPSSKIFQSIIKNRNPIQNPISSVFSQSFLRNLHLHNGLKRKSPFLDGAKRFHHQRTARSYEIILKTEQRKRALIVPAFLIASGVVITLCFGNLETVPYSKRTHVTLLPRTLEKYLGNCLFELIKEDYEGKILAPDHPNSIRVQRISQAVIEAATKRLSSNEHSRDDNRGITLKKGKSRKKPEPSHLESFEWEVIVVDKYVVNAYCLPGGKIVVYNELLMEFKKNDEVAFVIGHEVGHAVARHIIDSLLKTLWSIIVKMILWQCLESRNLAIEIYDTLFEYCVTLPFARRHELEADYIGLLLAASAGYDPRVAPKVLEKLGKISGSKEEDDFSSTHPLVKKRVEKLSQAEVMEEALSIYRQQLNNLISCSNTLMT